MPQKPSFRGKRSPRKQSSSQTYCQPCKPSCLANLIQYKRSSQRTSAPSLSLLYCSSVDTNTHGIRGNEIADHLAKEGRKNEQPPSHLSNREVNTLFCNKKKTTFHCKTGGYNPNQDALHLLPRHQHTTILRLRTGHCRLNSHLKRIGVTTSVQCPWWECDQIPVHYLQSCSLHLQAKQQIWPTCVSLKIKLWRSAEDLFLISKYAALTGERI